MRFILLAFALLGVAFYISNPEVFGAKRNFQIAENGRVVPNQTGGANFDFAKIGEFGGEMFDMLLGSDTDSVESAASSAQNAATDGVTPLIETASATPAQTAISETPPMMLSAIQTPDLGSYDGQLAAIARALQDDPMTASANMRAATVACLDAQAPAVLANYFVGIVQLIAETSQLPEAEQTANFTSKSQPLTELVKAWMASLPAAQRGQVTQELQNWAGRPTELVACHQPWLTKAP